MTDSDQWNVTKHTVYNQKNGHNLMCSPELVSLSWKKPPQLAYRPHEKDEPQTEQSCPNGTHRAQRITS